MKTFLTLLLALVAIVAFAGNSVLTRLALAPPVVGIEATPDISPAMFMGLRLLSGALTLAGISLIRGHSFLPSRSDATGLASLFVYAIAFTYAYVSMGAATGALILFGVVQLTISAIGLLRGDRPRPLDMAGIAIAFLGMGSLLLPKATAPPPLAGILMISAGVAWGIYTVEGRKGGDAISGTARNFFGAGVLAAAWLLATRPEWPSRNGLGLALTSGIVTSALGYVIWYLTVPRVSVYASAALQLLVPALAAVGGYLLLSEALPPQFLLSSALVLGGVALTLRPRRT